MDDKTHRAGPCIEPTRNTRALPRAQPGILGSIFGFTELGCLAALFVIGMFFSGTLEGAA